MTYADTDELSLDFVTPIDALLQLSFGVGTDEATIDGSVLTTTPDWSGAIFDWPPLFNQPAHGPISHLLPASLFAFTSVADEKDIPEFCDLTTLYGAFIIGYRMKTVVDTFSIPNSETWPVEMVLRSRDGRENFPGDDFDNFGGGPVVHGKHWLWNTCNYLDLVDWNKSTQKPYWIEGVRSDLAGAPLQTFSLMSNKDTLSLRLPDYAANPVFRILGSGVTFISPDFARALAEAGIVRNGSTERYATIVIRPYLLDRPRHTACLIARRQNPKVDMPPIRILGTTLIEEYSSAMFSSAYFLKQ